MMVMIIWGGGMIVPLPPSLPNLKCIMHAYVVQAKRRKPWPGRPETTKENRTPKPKEGESGEKGQFALKGATKITKKTLFF